MPRKGESGYDAYRESQAEISRERSASGRDIGEIPPIANVRRRGRCRGSLRLFCETYNPDAFALDWSEDHLRAIARIEEAAMHGALYAFAMPRGNGKTSLCRHAALWVLSYHHSRYVFIIGANDSKAKDSLAALRMFIRFLPTYAEDFPEIAFPAQQLAGIANRASGQTCGGEPTLIEWAADKIVLPTVKPPSNWPKSWELRADGMVPTSGSVVSVSGLTGEGIRGSLKTLSTGEQVRPDFVLIDDPQTAESAHSRIQNQAREQLIAADVLGMAGPGKSISAAMPCTVIAPGDFIDRILDRSKHPLWRGERTRMMKSMPTNLEAWDRYFEVYRECVLDEPPDLGPANKYYKQHREELDAGAEAGWEARKLDTEVSAIQSAMHLYYRDRRAFFAEYQNDPLPLEIAGKIEDLDAGSIGAKCTGEKRGVVPDSFSRVTAFVDVGAELLYWCKVAWDDAFAGSVIDYGTYPEQSRSYFANADARPSLKDRFPHHDATARVYAGLKECLAGQIFVGERKPDRCLIDAGWNTALVHQFCRQHPLAALLMPSMGWGIGASGLPMSAWPRKPGETPGDHWRIRPSPTGGGRQIIFDANHWKTFVAQRLMTPTAGVGSMGLFGTARDHDLFIDHLLAEYRIETEGRGRKVQEWKARPERNDNHWLDCLVGCAVAASLAGLRWSASAASGEPVPVVRKPKMKLSELYFRKHGERAV